MLYDYLGTAAPTLIPIVTFILVLLAVGGLMGALFYPQLSGRSDMIHRLELVAGSAYCRAHALVQRV
ncbi:MAG: hypothetical protein AAF439_12350 [Pseudomonadota bacterium]